MIQVTLYEFIRENRSDNWLFYLFIFFFFFSVEVYKVIYPPLSLIIISRKVFLNGTFPCLARKKKLRFEVLFALNIVLTRKGIVMKRLHLLLILHHI